MTSDLWLCQEQRTFIAIHQVAVIHTNFCPDISLAFLYSITTFFQVFRSSLPPPSLSFAKTWLLFLVFPPVLLASSPSLVFPRNLKQRTFRLPLQNTKAFLEVSKSSGGMTQVFSSSSKTLPLVSPAAKHSESSVQYILTYFAFLAKRAYLNTLTFPPSILTSASGVPATIRPYDGPDAQVVIQNVNARGQHHSTASRSHNPRAASVSIFPNARSTSGSIFNPNSIRNGHASTLSVQHVAITDRPADREPSPTLPSLPSHPTLNALISSSLGDPTASTDLLNSDPAISNLPQSQHHELSAPPRIGDPGKRMLGAALGVRHPGLGPRMLGNRSISPGNGMEQVQRAMGGLVVAE